MISVHTIAMVVVVLLFGADTTLSQIARVTLDESQRIGTSGGSNMRRPASLISALFLISIALGHILRLAFDVSIIADGYAIPMWPSVIAIILLSALAIWLLKERRS